MKLRFVLCFLILGCSTTRVAPAPDNLQLRLVEFADHPDPNTGPPHLISGAQPWPADLAALNAAANQWTDKSGYVYDVRRDSLSPSLVEELEETTARVVSVGNESARISVHMDGTPDPVEVTIPINTTVVLGSERGDDRHAFVALSLLDRDHVSQTGEVYSTSDPSVTPPRILRRSSLPASAAAREHQLRGTVVQLDIDERGHVVSVHAPAGRFLSAEDQKAIEDSVRTWTFAPATRNGNPVRVMTVIPVDYDR